MKSIIHLQLLQNLSRILCLNFLLILVNSINVSAQSDIIHYYRFENGIADAVASGTGNIIDDGPSASHGNPSGPIYRSDVPVSIIPSTGEANNLSLEFDGINDEVIFSSMFPFHAGVDDTLTLEFWVKYEVDGHYDIFWTRPTTTPDKNRFNMFLLDGEFSFDYRQSDGTVHYILGYAVEPGLPVPINEWTHIAIVKEGTSYKFYINGSLEATRVDPLTENLPTQLGWSISGRSGFRFAGLIDEILITDHALEPEEFMIGGDEDDDGYTITEGDCDDDDAEVNPDATEICDETDNDCDGMIDEKYGAALSFDGSDDFVEVPDNDLLDLDVGDAFTVECWVYRTGGDAGYHIFAKREGCGGYNYQCWGTSSVTTFTGEPDATAGVWGPVLPLNTWVYYTATFDGVDTTKLYFNGELVEVDSKFGPIAALGPVNSGSLRIGTSGTCPEHFPGMIDEFRIWRSERTQEQILEDMCSSPIPEDEPDLALYFTFDEGSGTTVYDETDNNLDGTLNNFSFSGTSDWVESEVECYFDKYVFYYDGDGDGFGISSVATNITACSAPVSYVSNSDDCDDTQLLYADVDDDGYGSGDPVACGVSSNADCDDGNNAINPGVSETCNGIDDNCDGNIDEGVLLTFYADTDSDTYGDASNTTLACSAPSGYVSYNTDCDDTNGAINPGATEVCNGVDDNCDGNIDEGVLITFYADVDGDLFGDASSTTLACSAPSGFVSDNTDCDDTNASINPGATEICNGIDDDCDGSIDEGVISAVITPSGATTFCKGGSVVLNANSGTGYTYQWTKNGLNISGATGSSISVNKTGEYRVIITVPGGCEDTSEAISVIVNPTPNATITNLDGTTNLCVDSSIKLKANNGSGLTYQWYKGGTAISGATNQVYFATATGNYKVKVTNSSGCSKVSSSLTIVNDCRIEEAKTSDDISIYPNPGSGIFTLQANIADKTIQTVIIELYDVTGTMIASMPEEITNGTLNETIVFDNSAAAGIYFVKVRVDDVSYMERIVLTR